jgi:NADPH:quinone reductase-like Zn-dependent oxidoreductase
VVEDVGNSIWEWRIGDKVALGISAMNQVGSHANFVDIYPACAVRLNRNEENVQWACVGYSGLSAYYVIEPILQSTRDYRRIAVIGGSGGTGSFAIQMIKKWMGKHIDVVTSASDPSEVLCADRVLGHQELIMALENKDIMVDWIVDCGNQKIVDNQMITEDIASCKIFNGINRGGGFSTLNASLVSDIDKSGSLLFGLPKSISHFAQAKMACHSRLSIHYNWAFHRDNAKVFKMIVKELNENSFGLPRVGLISKFDEEGVRAAYNYSKSKRSVIQMQ